MQERHSQIPVFEENIPIGTIYEDQILNPRCRARIFASWSRSDEQPVRSSRTAPVERVTHILSHENPAVFVDMGNAHFEILTKYDLMSTVASLMEQKR
jgi:predicted transcriptional regulator